MMAGGNSAKFEKMIMTEEKEWVDSIVIIGARQNCQWKSIQVILETDREIKNDKGKKPSAQLSSYKNETGLKVYVVEVQTNLKCHSLRKFNAKSSEDGKSIFMVYYS